LKIQLIPKNIEILEQFHELLTTDEKQYYFQQDNAPPHKSKKTRPHLEKLFNKKIIPYPPRSPDLTPLDYYLWGHMKEMVYKDNPQTIDELKTSITSAIQNINPEIPKRVFNNMNKRAQMCINAQGGHFEHLLH
jgi:hypothetical protein